MDPRLVVLPPNQVPMAFVVRILAPFGLSPQDIGRAAGFDPSTTSVSTSSISPDQYNAVLNWAVEVTGDNALVIRIAETLDVPDLHLFGYILQNSPNLGECLRNYVRYHKLFSREHEVLLREGGDLAFFVYKPGTAVRSEPIQDVVLTIASWVSGFRRFLGQDWAPVACQLAIARPACHRELTHLLRVEPSYLAPVNAIIVPGSDLRTPFAEADPTLLAILRDQVDRLLAQVREEDEVVYRLRMHIAGNIGNETFCMEAAAGALNMSLRSLHRKLDALGTSFSKLRKEIAHQLAREALSSSRVSITEIGRRLGYSETAAFTRAFRQAEGLSPRDYRKQASLTKK